jgi:hypothetical protein
MMADVGNALRTLRQYARTAESPTDQMTADSIDAAVSQAESRMQEVLQGKVPNWA